MRVIDTGLGELRSIAVSPDGRFVAASGDRGFVALEWATGEPVPLVSGHGTSEQIAFGPTGGWAVRVASRNLWSEELTEPVLLPRDPALRFTGGVAVWPGGKQLVATTDRATGAQPPRLECWSLPALKRGSGFEAAPYRRLAFSPNGQFLAGVWSNGFESRFAQSGGIDYRHRMPRGHAFDGPGFVAFDRGSTTCAFGWQDEFHVLDTSTGTSKPGPRVAASFRDAAFSTGADLFATVNSDGRLRFWNPQTWQVVREYDWQCGPLTCLAFSPDGTAGVCGTDDGRLVQFDVDV